MISDKQMTVVSLEQLVSKNHQYSKFSGLFDFEIAAKELAVVESEANYKGYMSEVFTFVDASHLIAKASLWKERDEGRRQK